MALYKILSACSAGFRGELCSEIRLLYAGGYDVQDAAARFLPRYPSENPRLYADRIKGSGYIGYLASIIDGFASEVFQAPLAMMPAADADDASTPGTLPTDEPYYRALAADVDMSGTPLSSMLRRLLVEALICGRAYALLDFPADADGTEPAASLAEEDARGSSRAYVVQLPVESVISWSRDDRQRLIWAVVRKVIPVRESPLDPPGLQKIQFKVWTRQPTGVTWQLYETPVHPEAKPPKPNDDVPLVGQGVVSFPEIPIIELELPPGLWAGNKIGPLVREHYTRRSALVAAQNKSLFAIPVAYLGPEMSGQGEALPSDVQMNPNRARSGPRSEFERQGWMCLGADDKIEFAEPTGAAYSTVHEQLQSLVDEIHRSVGQMAASVAATSTALGRSGDSKALDRQATTIVVDALAALVKTFAKRLYDTISAARGESVIWEAQGLDRADYDDRSQLLQEALAVENIPIPSPTFVKTFKTKLALALLTKLDPQTANTIRDEISDAIDAEPDDTHPEPDADEDPNGQEKPDDTDEEPAPNMPEDGKPKPKIGV